MGCMGGIEVILHVVFVIIGWIFSFSRANMPLRGKSDWNFSMVIVIFPIIMTIGLFFNFFISYFSFILLLFPFFNTKKTENILSFSYIRAMYLAVFGFVGMMFFRWPEYMSFGTFFEIPCWGFNGAEWPFVIIHSILLIIVYETFIWSYKRKLKTKKKK